MTHQLPTTQAVQAALAKVQASAQAVDAAHAALAEDHRAARDQRPAGGTVGMSKGD